MINQLALDRFRVAFTFTAKPKISRQFLKRDSGKTIVIHLSIQWCTEQGRERTKKWAIDSGASFLVSIV